MHKLNREQQDAVECGLERHCLVAAGPGSGKTRFLVARIERITQNTPMEERCKILCFAFTNEAANEIQARVNDSIKTPDTVTVSTIHRFCTGVLGTFARLSRPGSQTLRVVKESQHFSTFLIENVPLKLLIEASRDLRKLNRTDIVEESSDSDGSFGGSDDENNTVPCSDQTEASRAAKSLVRTLRGLQNGSIDIESIASLGGLTQAYRIYNSAMECANLIDIRCIVGKFVEKFELVAPLLGDYRYLLVDEFQDLDLQQLELVKLFIKHGLTLTAVGDFNQSIYSWRSRPPKEEELSKPQFKTRKRKVVLGMAPTSYASLFSSMGTSNYSEFSFIINHRNDYEIARSSNLLVGKSAVESKESPTALGMARVVVCRSVDEEIAKIIQLLRCMHSSDSLKDCAILVRYNTDKEKLRSLLKQVGIPTVDKKCSALIPRKSTANNSNATKSFKTIMSLIRAISQPNDVVAFITAIKFACLTVHNKDIEMDLVQTLSTTSEFANCQQWWSDADLFDPLCDNTTTEYSLDSIQVKYDTRTLNGIRVKSLVSHFVANIRKCMQIESLESLVAEIKSVFKIKTTRDIGMLEDLVRGRNVPIKDSVKFLREPDKWGYQGLGPINGVYVSTIHSAKGREWSTVIIPFVNEGTIPSMVGEIDEERRVLYVGMTRAKNNLILTCHQSGRTLPSRFISDCQIRPCERFDDILSRFG